MLRQGFRRLLGAGSRSLSTSAARLEEAAAAAAGPKEFTDAWTKFAPPQLNPPEYPSKFVSTPSTGESLVQGELFPVNFYTPHGIICDGVKVRRRAQPTANAIINVTDQHAESHHLRPLICMHCMHLLYNILITVRMCRRTLDAQLLTSLPYHVPLTRIRGTLLVSVLAEGHRHPARH